MSQHYIEKCTECKTVINQCRCPSKNKPVYWFICSKCSKQNKETKDDR